MFKQVYTGSEVRLQFDFVANGQTVLVSQPQADIFDPFGNKIDVVDLIFSGGHYLTYWTAPSTTLGSYVAVGRGKYGYEDILANSQVRFDVVSSLSTELVTLDEVKEYLRIDDFSEDSFLRALLLAASAAILAYTQLKLGSVSETERCFLKGATQYGLRYFPISEITEIRLNDVDLVEDSDYFVELSTGLIKFFVPQTGFFECTYTFGLSQIPSPVKLACLKLVAALYNLRESEGFSSRRLLSNVENYLRDTKMDVMAEVRSLLAPFKRKLA